jgi:hypothetical protein
MLDQWPAKMQGNLPNLWITVDNRARIVSTFVLRKRPLLTRFPSTF